MPLQPQLSNKAKLERLLRSRDYPAAVAFAASKKREDFPQIHHLPPEPRGWFPFDLLRAMPTDTPLWLREEWTTNAIESLKMRLTISEESWKELSNRYPRMAEELSRHANALKESTSKDMDEGWWLRQFDLLNARPKPQPDRFDPTQLPLPQK